MKRICESIIIAAVFSFGPALTAFFITLVLAVIFNAPTPQRDAMIVSALFYVFVFFALLGGDLQSRG